MVPFDPSFIAIGLSTFYPKWYKGNLRSIKHTDKIRGDLALEFVQIAKKAEYQIVVSDGKSSKTFKKVITSISGINIIMRRVVGLSPSKRRIIKKASKLSNVKVIVLCEPEKVSLIDSINRIVQPLLTGEADIIIPKRQEDLFKLTYPNYQDESETEANILYNENLKLYGLLPSQGEELDLFFGPRAFINERKIVSLFLKKYVVGKKEDEIYLYLGPEGYSNTLFFPLIEALKRKFLVKSVTVPFSYPKLQKENEEKGERDLFITKRKNQRMGILIELLHFLQYLRNKPGSKLKLAKQNL